MGIRQRTDARIEPRSPDAEKQMEGWITSQRYRNYCINPINFIRISTDTTTNIDLIEEVNYTIRDLSKTEDTTNMIKIEKA